MGRALKYDIPGDDWRRGLDEVAGPAASRRSSRPTSPRPCAWWWRSASGAGEFLLDLAAKHPDTAFVGVEVSFKRVLKMARRLARSGLRNVRLVEGRGQLLVEQVCRARERRRVLDQLLGSVAEGSPRGPAALPGALRGLDRPARSRRAARCTSPPTTVRTRSRSARCSRTSRGSRTTSRRSAGGARWRVASARATRRPGAPRGEPSTSSSIAGVPTEPGDERARAADRCAAAVRRPVAPNLKDFSLASLRERFAALGVPALSRRPGRGLALPARRRGSAGDDQPRSGICAIASADEFDTRALEVERVQRSADGTRKLVLRARDGARGRGGADPGGAAQHACASPPRSDVRWRAPSARPARSGSRATSRTAEIVDQVCRARDELAGTAAEERISNIVFMGMGEPLLNLPAVLEAIRILVDPKAFAMAPRRVTVSTAGPGAEDPPAARGRARSTWRCRCTPCATRCATCSCPSTGAFRSAVLLDSLRGTRSSCRRAGRSSSSTP